MQLHKGEKSSTRYSFPTLPVPAQSPSLLMNKREQNRQSFYSMKTTSSKVSLFDSENVGEAQLYKKKYCVVTTTKKVSIDNNSYKETKKSNIFTPSKPNYHQKRYETAKEMAAMSDEIDNLTEKVALTERKVSKWKREFKELQLKFMHVISENTKVKEELEKTSRMLEESEHIRSRWYVKTTQQDVLPTANSTGNTATNSLPKKLSQR